MPETAIHSHLRVIALADVVFRYGGVIRTLATAIEDTLEHVEGRPASASRLPSPRCSRSSPPSPTSSTAPRPICRRAEP